MVVFDAVLIGRVCCHAASLVFPQLWRRKQTVLSRWSNGRFGPEGLAHGFDRFQVGPANQVHAIGHCGKDACHEGLTVAAAQTFQRFLNRFRLPWQVDDQRLIPDHRDLAREDGGWHKLQADLAHLLAKTGHFLVCHRQRGLRRDITQRRAGAAGGQNQRNQR